MNYLVNSSEFIKIQNNLKTEVFRAMFDSKYFCENLAFLIFQKNDINRIFIQFSFDIIHTKFSIVHNFWYHSKNQSGLKLEFLSAYEDLMPSEGEKNFIIDLIDPETIRNLDTDVSIRVINNEKRVHFRIANTNFALIERNLWKSIMNIY